MKTAISIPDELFRKAERTAKRLGLSRSSFFSHAIEEYLKNHTQLQITKQLDDIYSQETISIDKGILKAQSQSIEREEW